MRKTALIISMMAILSLNVSAQEGSSCFGFRMGPNIGWVGSAYTNAKGTGIGLGFGAGLYYDRYFSDRFGFSTGLEYNLLRMRCHLPDYRRMDDFLEYTSVEVDRKFKGSYLEIPVKLKVKTDVADIMDVFVEAGAGVAVNLSAKAKDSFDFYGHSHSDASYVDVSDRYRLLQVSFKFGIGAEYEISSDLTAVARLSFSHGFSNMLTRSMKNQTGCDLKSNFIGLEVGIQH